MTRAMTAGNCLRIVVFVLTCSAVVLAQPSNTGGAVPATSQGNERIGSHEPGLENLAPDWFQRPARKTFAWEVHVFPPVLTYRQRQLVQIEATFRGSALQRAGLTSGDLFLVLKVGTQERRWLPGYAVRHFEIPPRLPAGSEVRALFAMYVEPGAYTASLIAFERRTGKGNLWHGAVRVQPIYRDPLPGRQDDIPAVEFLPAAPPGAKGRLWMMSHDPWEFGEGKLTIPLANDVPVEVDLVANLSLSGSTNSRRSEAPEWAYQINAATVTEISRVISEMSLKNGCVRFSALDIPRQELLANDDDTRTFDWSRIHAAFESRERAKIDARTLAGEKKTPSFLSKYVAQLAAGSRGCGTHQGKPLLRILIVVGDAFTFPYGTEMTQVQPTRAWALCYYLELVPVTGPRWDEIRRVLKPLNPVRLEVSTPAEFRRAFVQLIHEIERVSATPPGSPSQR